MNSESQQPERRLQLRRTSDRVNARRKVRLRDRLSIHIFILPNLLTTGNMFSGFFSIISAIRGDFLLAAYAIVAAAVFDMLDGRVARMTRSTSQFGAQYDSMSDLLSFGVAPGLLVFLWALQPFGRVGWLAGFLYVTCAALRLARFNVQSQVLESKDFQGLPSPMSAGIIASSVLAYRELGVEGAGNWALLFITFLLGFVMVSPFRYRSFKELDLRKRVPFRYLIFGILIFLIVAWWPEVMLFVLFLGYAVLGAIFGILNIGKGPRIRRYVASAPLETDLLEEDEDESN